MLIHHTTLDRPTRPGQESIWLDDALLDDEQDEDAVEEQDPDLTESALIAQLGLKGLPDDAY